jgi:anti-sigma factor RsiW
MTSPANDTSELTAYALGELQAHQAADIHRLLTDCPAAISELEQIEAVTDALRQHAPIPQERLNPDQRHAVLRPVQMPRRITPMQPRPIMRRPSAFWPVMGGIMKAAAVVAVAGFAYWLGRHTDLTPGQATPEVAQPEKPAQAPTPTLTPPPAEALTASAPVQAPVPNPSSRPEHLVAGVTEPKVAGPSPSKAPVLVVPAALPPQKPTPAPAVAKTTSPKEKAPARVVASPSKDKTFPITPLAVTRPNAELAFVTILKRDIDQLPVHPADIRPAPARSSSKELMASPAPVNPPKSTAETKPRLASEVYIHAWQAEVASCPWNPATRLLRVTLQLPPNQAAATDSSNAFPLRVAFDRRHVREFRRLCERHTPATSMDTSGTQTVWYEFQPASDEAIRSGRPIATVTLEKSRFTVPSDGPFDGSKLSVLDRGVTWTAAREDFLFESAVVGFSMLLRGDHNSPALNHQVILSLAEKGRGSDSSGERSRFIRQVVDAGRAAGL